MTPALHIASAGGGPPLVLLHGWMMHSGVWGTLPARLARSCRVHAVDLPGHGHSPPLLPFTLEGIVRSLAAAFEREERALTVLGWSLGGLVAMRWALAHPARVAALILVATTPRFVAGPGWPHAMTRETLVRFGDELHVAWKATVLRFLTLQVRGSEQGRAALAGLRRQLFARGEPAPEVVAGAFDLLLTADLRADAPRIAQRTLVVSGTRDTLAYPAAGEWLGAALPSARFASIDGAAHVPFLSHPDPFDRALDGFLGNGNGRGEMSCAPRARE